MGMIQNFDRCHWSVLSCALLVSCGLTISARVAVAQQPAMVMEGRPVSPEQAKAMMEAQQRAQAAQGGQPQPGQEQKSDDKEKKEGEGGDKDKKEEGSDSVKRPEKPPRVPDPRELEVALDKNGRVPPFNFIGQAWPDVMQWLANMSKSSLDWQELPSGYLNLTTQRAYTVEELRDVINRHLHARGFTAVQTGEVLSVFKIEKLDPSVVRRVTEDELYDAKPYDFVKVSFELPAGMEVDKAKEDIKQVLSPNAKVFPLMTTKRILVIDAVANLRMVSALLNEERAVQDGHVMPYQRVLKYARADQVIDILYVVLGMDPKSRPTQMDLQLQQKKLELMQQMQQRGTDVSKMLKQDGPPVYLAYNRQRNSVMANAPPEHLKIIDRTLDYLDVPFGGDDSAEPGTATSGSGQREMRKYPLTTLDPENFITTLQEIGGLSPYAEFKVDKKSKVLFALATEADHAKIKTLIADFDGTGREFHVVWLRRLPADAVASTIYNLMAGQTEEKEDDNDRFRYWSPWDRNENEDKDEPVKGFGVDADIENNRLLLWANEEEMERVRGLLEKLGEMRNGQADPRPVRFIEPAGDASTAELLRQLKNAWSATGENELIIKLPEKPKIEETDKKPKPAGETKPAEPAADRSAAAMAPPRVSAQYVDLESATSETEAAAAPAGEATKPVAEAAPITTEPASKAPPVTITVTEDGRLMLSSEDSAALDQMEQLIDQLTPPQRRFQIYRLKHIPALHMYYDLADYFKEDMKEEGSGYTRDWYGFMIPKGDQGKGPKGLAKRRKLMITYDVPNNAILVSNASASQTMEIEQLIAEFDQPARKDSVEIRETRAVKIRYSKASVIANAVKEVYRDLLSTRDKEFERGGDQRQQGRGEQRTTVINYGGSSSSSDDDSRSSIKVGFEGALSIGVDEVSNMLIVSAQKAIFDDVVRMINELDEEAAPKAVVHVHRLKGTVTAAALRETIDDALSKPWPGGRPEQEAGRGGGGRGEGDRRRGDGDRRRGDRGRGDRDNDND